MASVEEVEEVLFEIVSLLEREGIPYAVMGGLAVRVYSIPRATQDVDITISLDREKLPGFRDLLYEQGCSIPPVYDSDWLDQVAGLPLFKVKRYIGEHGIDIDIFVAESRFQEQIIRRRCMVEISGNQVALVSPEDLMLLKLIASRPRDLVDVQDLLFAMGQLDEPYMRQWAAQLGVAEQLEQALREAQG